MNSKKIYQWGCLVVLLMFPVLSYTQNDRIFVEEGDKIYNFGDYEDAILFYQLAIEENPKNVRAHYMAGSCFLITTSEKKEAVHYLLTAYELDQEINNSVLFKIGDGYRYRYEFDSAIEYFNKYIDEINNNPRFFEGLDTESLIKRAERRIHECENAKKYVANPVGFKAVNAGGVINSSAEDYAPTLNNDETVMYFTSRREGSTGGFKDTDNKYFEDIWVVEKVDGEWGTPVNMGGNINTKEHESNIGLSPDENILYIYHTENNGDIYYSERKDGEWQEIKSMGKTINTDYQETSIYHASNDSYMFFTSSRPGGEGELDIYVMRRTKKGKWSDPENLGNTVNTEYSEEGPYFDVETSTLYFSSKGHEGMGGYDLYKSVWDTVADTWSDPQNLGFPINSADDELFYTIRESSGHAYYASFKDDSYGYSDIYLIVPKEEEEPIVEDSVAEEEPLAPIEIAEVEYKTINVKVLVKDSETSELVDGFSVKVYRVEDKDIPVVSGDGQETFTFALKDTSNQDYIVMVEANDYVFQSKNIAIDPTADQETKELTVFLSKKEVFVPKVLRNIYFSFDNYSLKDESSVELDQLVKMMKANPSMTIEIAGHTDFKGSQQYNISLAQKRANSVKRYLTDHGISSDRIVAKGYGEKYPLATNDDELEGRELNRRTEFIILTK